MSFPSDFIWGAATASYQIEGAAYADGKGLGIWDVFCKRDNTIWNQHNGDVACDHYHRYCEDVELMRSIGLGAYRLEVSWPRILPEGKGRVNQKGLEFYDRLIDKLLEKEITPWVTLYHWNLPQELQIRGGWQNPDSSHWFSEFVTVVVDRLSDRVQNWMTINEPQVIIGNGHLNGKNAPGLQLSMSEALQAGHNVLLAHGRAVSVIRDRAKTSSSIGFAPCGLIRCPQSNKKEDVEAAKKATFSVEPDSVWNSAWWMDPVYLGRYPSEALEMYGNAAPDIKPGDMELISQKLDFFGANIYTSINVQADESGKPQIVPHKPGYNMSTYDWAVVPDLLYWAGEFFYQRYKLPIVITENGTSMSDIISRDGKVHDPQREEFIAVYLSSMKKAIKAGIPYTGYFYWSLLDNFEWQWGYKHRFGLVHVDFSTGKRTLKDSAHYYRDIIKSNGKDLE
ncbi:GH1 family beta-glucosidase [Chitinispirillales bacterium ANBcel5]|uniref:GH1 family beta-glucosidase n=1 Tax=Cellulosispirillum alkaliphilum TaxID=3039283 RepID=UPI002A54EA52|nr:GH1 family beta-glucosidase [Chitinispirillales bacterium ANBcel5]